MSGPEHSMSAHFPGASWHIPKAIGVVGWSWGSQGNYFNSTSNCVDSEKESTYTSTTMLPSSSK
jgi:hypothetical protein